MATDSKMWGRDIDRRASEYSGGRLIKYLAGHDRKRTDINLTIITILIIIIHP